MDEGTGRHVVDLIHRGVEWAAVGIEVVAVVVIVAGVLVVVVRRGTVRYLFGLERPGAFESYKHQLGRSLLLGRPTSCGPSSSSPPS